MNSISYLNAGQGGMPPVPAFEVPCEKCGKQIELVDGKIPLICIHCGYHLRLENDSMLSHFFFVLRYRMFTWRGRCTRKELWSFELISHFLLFLFILAYFSAPFFALFVYILIIGIPQIFLFARRLHDIGLSATTVVVHLILAVSMLCTMVLTYAIQQNIASETYNADEVATQPYSDDDFALGDEENDALVKPERNPTVYSLILVSCFLNFSLQGLSLFFLVITFIDSKRGTNKYGPSRKYPLAIS